MEVEKQTTEMTQKFEDINLQAGENVEIAIKKPLDPVDDKLKRNSLSKFFRFKGLKGSATEVTSTGGAEKIPKTNTLTRMFSKKEKPTDLEMGSEAKTRRSFIMRGLVVPWISSKPSIINLHKPLEVAPVAHDEEAAASPEIATCSQIF